MKLIRFGEGLSIHDELKSKDSLSLARQHALSLHEIVESYTSLTAELKGNGGRIAADFHDPQTPLNTYADYIRKVACALIVNHEFIVRKVLLLPDSAMHPRVMRRRGDVAYHEKQVRNLTCLLEELYAQRNAYFDAL